ncbi:MAG: putative RNA uridine N3 methyltransferase [Nitrososphaerota archaeon]
MSTRFEEVPRRRCRLDVLLPSSLTAETPHLREKTFRIGLVARFLATFRVDNLIIYYEDLEPDKNAELIKDVMDYLNTAPYLRKRLFPIKPSLRYAGLLPPLNIPTHPEADSGGIFHYREGLVVSPGRVDAGLGKLIKVKKPLKKGTKVVVVANSKSGEFKLISRKKSPVYAGFKTAIVPERLDELVAHYDVKIATSRLGKPFHELAQPLSSKLSTAKNVCIAFGSAKRGLYDIAKLQNFNLDEVFDFVINVVPEQGVRTIRTEEAVCATLATISALELLFGRQHQFISNHP